MYCFDLGKVNNWENAEQLHYSTRFPTVKSCVLSSLRKHPFLLALRRWGRFGRNVPSGYVLWNGIGDC